MRSSWSFQNFHFAEIEVKALRGRRGIGFYLLEVCFEVLMQGNRGDEGFIVKNIEGSVKVRDKNNQDQALGHLRQRGRDCPIVSCACSKRSQMWLEIELDSKRVETLERIRNGKELTFSFETYGTAIRNPDQESETIYGALSYLANQSEWIEVLDQMGYKQMMLLEIPSFDHCKGSQFPEATRHLKSAQEHLLSGRYRETIGECRLVLETVTRVLKDEQIQSCPENQKKMDKNERLRGLRKALTTLCHPAHHADEIADSIQWDQKDARAVLLMTAAILFMIVEGAS